MKEYTSYELPDQDIPSTKKNKKWHIGHANGMINFLLSSGYTGRTQQIRDLEELTIARPVTRETITKPDGFELGGVYETYPLIESISEDITAKYLSRPLKRKVYSINKDAVNEKLDVKVQYLIEDIFRQQNEEINKDTGLSLETPNPDIELPDDIEEFMSKPYKTLAEEVGDDLITQFLDVNGYKTKIKDVLSEYLYGDTCAVFFDVKDGHPELVRCRYDECYYDIDPEQEVQDDINVFAFYKWYSENEIFNRFILDKEDKKKVKAAFEAMDSGDIVTEDIEADKMYEGDYTNYKGGITYSGWFDKEAKRHRLRVLMMQWKSRNAVKALIYTNPKTKKETYKVLPEGYKVRKRDTIRTVHFETNHFIKMLGPEIVLEYGELDERLGRIDNPAKSSLPVVALIGKAQFKTGSIRSIAAKLKGLQEYASDILFQIKQTVNSMEGKVVVYDAAQTPKQFIQTYGAKNAINRVLHHMRKDKLLIINSADKKDRHTFNQFTSLDLSNRGLLKDLTEALMLVDDLGRKFTGLTKEAQEGGEKYQTATGVNRAIISSNARLEYYYHPFDNFIGSVLSKYLQKAKSVYPNGKVFNQIFGDLQSKFFTIHKDFFDADLGIYIGDTAKDLRDKEVIDRGAEMTMGTTQDPKLLLNLIQVLEADSATESEAILERGIAAMQKAQEQARQDMLDQQKAAREDQKATLQNENTQKDLDRKNEIEVAKIYANNKTQVDDAKNASAERIKIAELENKLLLEREKNNKPASNSNSGSSEKKKVKATSE